MIRFQVDRTITRPRAEVFERLADIDAYGAWLPPSIIFRGGRFAAPGSNADVGVAYDEETPVGTFPGRIVEFEPPETIGFVTPMILMGVRVLESRPRYVLHETDRGTLVQHFAEGEFYVGWRLMELAGRRLARYERTRTMDALAKSFDTPGS